MLSLFEAISFPALRNITVISMQMCQHVDVNNHCTNHKTEVICIQPCRTFHRIGPYVQSPGWCRTDHSQARCRTQVDNIRKCKSVHMDICLYYSLK